MHIYAFKRDVKIKALVNEVGTFSYSQFCSSEKNPVTDKILKNEITCSVGTVRRMSVWRPAPSVSVMKDYAWQSKRLESRTWSHLLQILRTICSTSRYKINDLCFTVCEYRPHPVPDFIPAWWYATVWRNNYSHYGIHNSVTIKYTSDDSVMHVNTSHPVASLLIPFYADHEDARFFF
jgi:hypothetical protein